MGVGILVHAPENAPENLPSLRTPDLSFDYAQKIPTYHLPLTTYDLPLTTYNLRLTTYNLQLTPDNRPLVEPSAPVVETISFPPFAAPTFGGVIKFI